MSIITAHLPLSLSSDYCFRRLPDLTGAIVQSCLWMLLPNPNKIAGWNTSAHISLLSYFWH